MLNKKRYIICFEFLGAAFFGSQKQKDKRTVQQEIEKAICTLTKDRISIFLSGRTDAKVSAKFQCAHFDSGSIIENFDKFLYSLNSILPSDIKVFEIKEVSKTFHAQKSAKYKHYRYSILNDPVASVFSDSYLFYPYHKLDIERINKSLSYLVGYHDFSAFKSKSTNPYNDCTIYYARACQKKVNRSNFIFIDIIGNRFLYNMVRTIVGEVLFIERSNLDCLTMKKVLDSKNRAKAADVQEAKALCLEYVGYNDVNLYIQKKFIKEGK